MDWSGVIPIFGGVYVILWLLAIYQRIQKSRKKWNYGGRNLEKF